MIDFYDHPEFVHELLGRIADYNIAQVREALKYDIDAVYFGDDWGQQHGLQMGPRLWREFIYPQLQRMYGAVARGGQVRDDPLLRRRGRAVRRPGRHRAELLQPLPAGGDGRLRPAAPLPRPAGVSRRAVDAADAALRHAWTTCGPSRAGCWSSGREGGYIFAPAHDVEGDVPLENMLAAIELVQQQPRFQGQST